MYSTNTATFIWLIDPSGMFERGWIYNLLDSKIQTVNEIHNPNPDPYYDYGRIVPVIVFNHSMDYITVFKRFESANRSFIAIHLSDETLGDDFSFYSFASCKHVFRNYYHPIASELPNVTTFGLGYRSKIKSHEYIRARVPEYYNWCFAGNIHNTARLNFIIPFFKTVPYFYHATMDGFCSSGALSLNDYRRSMMESKFALCPPGQGNIDTFRLYEALELGCIPVAYSMSEHQPYDYWKRLFRCERIPFITADTPEEAHAMMCNILSNIDEYQRVKKEVRDFWREAKARWGTALAAALCDT